MFEKESKEYANKWLEHVKDLELQHKTDEKPEYIRIEEAHQCGAEFGYNKANEWHYVKDRDYPKEKGNYLVAWKRTHHVEEYGEWGFDVDLFNADEGYFECVGDYVIAWKEIVLPELPKESE